MSVSNVLDLATALRRDEPESNPREVQKDHFLPLSLPLPLPVRSWSSYMWMVSMAWSVLLLRQRAWAMVATTRGASASRTKAFSTGLSLCPEVATDLVREHQPQVFFVNFSALFPCCAAISGWHGTVHCMKQGFMPIFFVFDQASQIKSQEMAL